MAFRCFLNDMEKSSFENRSLIKRKCRKNLILMKNNLEQIKVRIDRVNDCINLLFIVSL